MTKIHDLEQSVYELYAARNPVRAEWADWLGKNHVPIVADNATRLARRFGANKELARAGALLHDIADTTMSRFAVGHKETSLRLARSLMQQAGFNPNEIELTVGDAIRYHSCHDGKIPASMEGKILATADALAHLQTDFYLFAIWAGNAKTLTEAKEYVLKKIERDFNNKILFDNVKAECYKDYERLKVLFSR